MKRLLQTALGATWLTTAISAAHGYATGRDGAGSTGATVFVASDTASLEAFDPAWGGLLLIAAGLALVLTFVLLIWSSKLHRRLKASFRVVEAFVAKGQGGR